MQSTTAFPPCFISSGGDLEREKPLTEKNLPARILPIKNEKTARGRGRRAKETAIRENKPDGGYGSRYELLPISGNHAGKLFLDGEGREYPSKRAAVALGKLGCVIIADLHLPGVFRPQLGGCVV